jgi:class 3 adenylate cyclase/tetratricopeptide (TPR) repeat protein
MRECPSCRATNGESAIFCSQCGTPLTEVTRHRERRLVTVLFCDLAESTALAEDLDPETLQGALDGYFSCVRGVIEQHGGYVEKFIGDAVVALFGVPLAHEDDAVRAIRAAVAVPRAMQQLNEDLRDLGVTLQVRVGLQSGDIIVDPNNINLGAIGGDALNTAARLQALARPGEVLLGAVTAELVADWAELTGGPPTVLKGKTRPERVFVLNRVRNGARTPRRVPFVGRARQLATLRGMFEECAEDGVSVLVTMLGVPGIGKSRLVSHLGVELADKARVLTGFTPAYGDAVAYAPVVGLLHSVAGSDAPDEVAQRLLDATRGATDSAAVVERLASLIGADERSVAGDTAWALRRLLEILAASAPVVVIVEDIHFGGAALLDLIDRVVSSVRGRVMIICTARPELLDQRPSWGGGKLRSTSISLGPLGSDDADELAAHLLAGFDVGSRDRLTAAAEGNPLYLEQLAALVSEADDDDPLADIPPTLRALLAARLDRLDAIESRVLDLAAVEGRQFRAETVRLLDGTLELADIRSALERLELRSLVSERADGSWQFAHALIQDAATRRTPKEDRAQLHIQLAEHLALSGSQDDEVVGAHFERAARLRRELGRGDDTVVELQRRAGAHFAVAGSRAFGKMDLAATAELLTRAAALLPEADATRATFMPDLGVALMEIGRVDEAERLLASAADSAGAPEVHRTRVQAQLLALQGVYRDATDAECEKLLARGQPLVARLEELDDHVGLAQAYVVMEYLYWVLGRPGEAAAYAARAVLTAESAGRAREQFQAGGDLGVYLSSGFLPVEEVQAALAGFPDPPGPAWQLARLAVTATAHAFRGDLSQFDLAQAEWADYADAHGLQWLKAIQGLPMAMARLEVGDGAGAEAVLRMSMETMDRLGDVWGHTTAEVHLPRALAAQGREAEAVELTEQLRAADFAFWFDSDTRIQQLHLSALTLRVQGRLPQAEQEARRCVDLAAGKQLTVLHTAALEQLADIVELGGRADDARQVRATALGIHEQVGNRAGAARVRAQLETEPR